MTTLHWRRHARSRLLLNRCPNRAASPRRAALAPSPSPRLLPAPTRRGPRTRPAPANTGPSRHTLGPATTLRIAPTAPATLANASLRRSAPLPATSVDRSEADAKREAQAKRERAFQEEAEAVLGVPTLIAPGGRERVDASSIVDGIEVIELAALPSETEARPAPATRAPVAEEEPEFIRSNQSRTRRGFSIIFGGGSLLLAVLDCRAACCYLSRRPAGTCSAGARCADAVVRSVRMHGRMADPSRSTGGDRQRAADDSWHRRARTDRGNSKPRRRSGRRCLRVEVTLTDSLNRPIARKVFTPADYLAAAGEPSSRIEDGLGSGSDYTIRLFFEARGVQAAGFLVYPFFI